MEYNICKWCGGKKQKMSRRCRKCFVKGNLRQISRNESSEKWKKRNTLLKLKASKVKHG